MNKIIFSLLFLFIATACLGQTQQTRYYNNEWRQKEVTARKAKFSETIIQNADSSVTTEIRDLKKDEIINSYTYKGNEPFGIWKYRRSNSMVELDYSFELKYISEDDYCKDGIPGMLEQSESDDSLSYFVPPVEGYLTIFDFVSKNVVYPRVALENGIMGRVYLGFTITSKGQIENIVVIKGTNILLDKEAVRVTRKLKFTGPPMLNGKAVTVCHKMPIIFQLR